MAKYSKVFKKEVVEHYKKYGVALIVYRYEDGNHPAPTPRKSVSEISRFI